MAIPPDVDRSSSALPSAPREPGADGGGAAAADNDGAADLFRSMVEHSPVGIFHAAPDGSNTYINPRAREIVGLGPAQGDGWGWVDAMHPEDRDRVLPDWERHRRLGAPFACEYRFVHPGGRVVWVLAQTVPERDAAGRLLGYVGTVTDITRHKLAEDALRGAYASLGEREQRYQALADASPVGIFRTSEPGHSTYVNARLCQLAGVTPAEARGEGWLRNLHPDDRRHVRESWRAVPAADGPVQFEHRFLHPDGRVVWVFVQVVKERDAAGRVVGYAGTVGDITRQKQAELKLRASEQRYQALAENSAVGIWQVTPDGYTTYINPAMRAMLELAPDEDLAGRTFREFFTPESLARSAPEHAKRARGVASSYEVELLGARGGRRSVMISGAPLFGPDGELASLIGTFTDITERKRVEQALGESESRFRLMAETVPNVVYTSLPEGACDYLNQRFYEYTGAPPGSGEAQGWAPLVHPDDLESLYGEWRRAADAPDGRFEHEFRLRMADGSYRWFVTRARALRDEGGRVIRWVGTSTDVDELKLAGQRLRDSEGRLRMLVEQVPAVLWATDASLRFTTCRGAALAALGYASDEIVGTSMYDFFQTRDERFPAIATARRALGGTPSNYELPWGGRTFQVHVEPLRDAEGAVIGAIGVALDITDRELAERALRDANEQLEQRVRSRTAQLEQAIEDLAAQVAQRERAEAALRQSEEHFKELADSNRRLLQELDHRVRNNLAGLLGLLPLMRDQTQDVDAFAAAMEARLRAMAQIHHLLAEGGWRAVPMRTLARTLLDALGNLANCPGDVTIDGAGLMISARQTLPLSMILLEWFTNSCKYGAFSVPAGRITIRWDVLRREGREWAALRWTEAGGPPIRQPVTPSLGTELVRSFASRELRGEAVLRFPESGVDHTLKFPKE
jgi:PAS domain S-box-containing protein